MFPKAGVSITSSMMRQGSPFKLSDLDYLDVDLQAYTARDLQFNDDGYNVSRWVHQGTGDADLDAVMAVVDDMPSYRGDGIEFNKSDTDKKNMGITAGGDFDYLHDGTGMSVYVVVKVKPESADERGGIFSTTSNGTIAGLSLSYNDLSSWGLDHNLRVMMGNGSANLIDDFMLPTKNLYEDNEFLIIGLRDSVADNFDIDVNNGEFTKTIIPSDTRGGSHSSILELGKFGANYFSGNFYRFVSFKQRLDDVDHAKVMDLLQKETETQMAINEFEKLKLFIHSDFGTVYDDQGFVESWKHIPTQDETLWQYSAARRVDPLHGSVPAIRIGGDIEAKIPFHDGDEVFYTGDLDDHILKCMIVTESLTTDERSQINKYIKQISSG